MNLSMEDQNEIDAAEEFTPEDCHFCGDPLTEADREAFQTALSRWTNLASESPEMAGPEPFAMCGECRADSDANTASLEADLRSQEDQSRNMLALYLGGFAMLFVVFFSIAAIIEYLKT